MADRADVKIGILGGGQLGRMLWEASVSKALRSQLCPSPVYHEAKDCPAGHAGAEIRVGKVTMGNGTSGNGAELEKLTAFMSQVDSFAVENEFLDLEAIETAWRESRKRSSSRLSLPIPSLEGLRIAQDKLEQKKFFLKNSLPTSEYQEITPEWMASAERLSSLHQEWQGLVLKKARMGYDGKGNMALPPQRGGAKEALDFAKIQAFCESAFTAGSRVYAEKFVPFTKEVALVSCQNVGGDFGHYPLIETIQKNGVCFLAYRALNEERNEKRAVEVARVIAKKLNMLGTFAVEFFVTATGELLVNEMAPRVHNSGHFSQRASRSSQFEMHLKSYWQKQWNPADFESAKAFAMVNLLGPEGLRGPVSRPQKSQIYWYDKESTSPGRKLGHIIGQSPEEKDLPRLIEDLKAQEKAWQESLRA